MIDYVRELFGSFQYENAFDFIEAALFFIASVWLFIFVIKSVFAFLNNILKHLF